MHVSSRFLLADLPTPLEWMNRLSGAIGGPDIWIKRDDQTGLATGGNKTRKLELLIADALAQEADVVLTVGAVQSNHCRQTAAAAARTPLDCLLVLEGQALRPTHLSLSLERVGPQGPIQVGELTGRAAPGSPLVVTFTTPAVWPAGAASSSCGVE